MEKNAVIVSSVVIAVIGVLAVSQSGNPDLITGMVGYKLSKGHHASSILGFIVIKLVAISVVTFLVSLIFWKTQKWVMKK